MAVETVADDFEDRPERVIPPVIVNVYHVRIAVSFYSWY